MNYLAVRTHQVPLDKTHRNLKVISKESIDLFA